MASRPLNGILDTVPDSVKGHFAGALGQLSAMQPNKPGTFPTNKNARTALLNKILSLEPEEQQKLLSTMATKAGHDPAEHSPGGKPCELCSLLMEHMPEPPAPEGA